MIDQRQLLCTFSSVQTYKNLIKEINKFYNVYNNKFFVFSNVKFPEEVFLTYNILNEKNFPKLSNTISIHRKKQTNTFYTLNAMNQIIRDENNGVFDKTFPVSWELYTDSIIMTGEPIKVLPIKMIEIISL